MAAHFTNTTHWICDSCVLVEACCQQIQFAAVDVANKCAPALVPTKSGMYSWFQRRSPTEISHDRTWKVYRDGSSVRLRNTKSNARLKNTDVTGRGMHRTLQHKIQTVSTSGDTTLLLFLPEDFYVDIEHVIEGECRAENDARCEVKAVHTTELIDIEQPAFSSPQHVVAIDIHWHNGTDVGEQLSVDASLHLRYSAPLQDGNRKAVALPQPMLRDSPRTTAATPLFIEVSAGDPGDYGMVVIATMLTVFTGAGVLLHSISKAVA